MLSNPGTRLAGVGEWKRQLVAAVVAVLAVAVAALGAASSASAATAQPYAAQVRAAHLTLQQAAALQAAVDKDIAQFGGRQVAANEIATAHGGAMLLALPGERGARVLPGATNLGFYTPATARAAGLKVSMVTPGHSAPQHAAVSPAAAGPTECWSGSGSEINHNACCPFYYFCAWNDINGFGTQQNFTTCGDPLELNGSGWNSYGSWMNNQTTGTKAYFENKSFQVIGSSTPALSLNGSFNWYPVWYVDPC